MTGSRPEGSGITPLPPEFQPPLEAVRQEMSRTITTQEPKGRGWARRVAEWLTPGHGERQAVNQAFAAYRDAPSESTLDIAIDHFRKACPRLQREARALALRLFLGAMDYCMRHKMRQENVNRVIRTGNAARELWSDHTNMRVYLIIVYCLVEKYHDLYAESLRRNARSGGPVLVEAFELAKKYFLEVITNKYAGYLGTLSRMQLGYRCMIRCMREHTTAGLEMCIEHWECALEEWNTPQADWHSEITLVAGPTSVDSMAAHKAMNSALMIYLLGVAYNLQYREYLNRDSRLKILNTSIGYFEQAQVLFTEIKDSQSERRLVEVMYSLAVRLLLRWEVTGTQSDVDRAKELLKTAQTVEKGCRIPSGSRCGKLKRMIKSKLTEIEGGH